MGWKDTIKPSTSSWRDSIVEVKPKETIDSEAAIRGAVQGASAGFADEGAGVIDALLSKTGGLLLEPGQKNPYEDKPLRQVYEEGRNEERAANVQAAQRSPKTYLAGQLAGGIATSAALPGAAMTQGAIQGAGLSEATNLPDMAKDVVLGAAVGKAGELAGKAVNVGAQKLASSSLLPTAAQTTGQMAEEAAAKALGATKSNYNQLGAEGVRNAAREALDEGIISPLASTKTMLQRIPEGKSDTVRAMLENKMAKEAVKPAMSHSDYVALAAGGTHGLKGIAVAGGAVATKKVVEKYKDQVLANSADKISKALESTPEVLGKYAPMLQQSLANSPKNFAITNFLLHSRDPEYQEVSKNIEK